MKRVNDDDDHDNKTDDNGEFYPEEKHWLNLR